VEKKAKEVDVLENVGWTEGTTTRMLEVDQNFNPKFYKPPF